MKGIRDFLVNPVVFGTVMSAAFVGLAAESLEWAFAAGFIVLVILHGIIDGVDRLLDELRKGGVLPRRESDAESDR